MNREPTEMELRVVKGIESIWIGEQDDPPSPLEMARAAIRAMREPTKEILFALQSNESLRLGSSITSVVHDFIDAASPPTES